MRNIKTKIPHGSQGMTLVELLVVMAMLSVVMMAVISLYIPVVQSTAAQTQVSDVQDNLRLALKTMTRDLLNGGFLVADDPIAFLDADPHYNNPSLTSRGTNNSQDFIIRTRVIGDGFARITASTASSGTTPVMLTIADDDMIDNFSANVIVRLFEPVAGVEVNATAYTVDSVDQSAKTITITPVNAITNNILPEAVMVRVKDASQPELQTIRYYLEDGALKREINENAVQILARNIDSVNFDYFPPGSSDRIKRVDIRLTGKTKANKNDALSGEKTRTFETSVQLRNIQ